MTKRFLWFSLAILVFHQTASAQKSKSDTVYTFPFHLDSHLIVFEGEMNGQPANFVFDTGAGLGLAGQDFVETGRIKAKKKVMTMRDANNNTKRVGTGTTKQMKIGGLKVKNAQSLVSEMPYLSCQDYYLLGSNVIKLINWKIDFDKMEISVSLNPFPVESSYLAMEVYYESSRPFTTLSFGGMKLSKVLIDTGYSRILDIDNTSDLIQSYLSAKEETGRTNKNVSLSTGALGQTLDETIQVMVDTLEINNTPILNVPTDFFETKSTKLGIGLFKALSHTTIINNSNSTYYFDLRQEPEFKDPFLLNLSYEEGRVVVSGKSLEADSMYESVEIGDVVTAINGTSTDTFTQECDFVNWYFTYEMDKMNIETEKGETLTFTRTKLK